MTTIAYDGRFLAADTRGTYGNDGICQAVCHKLRVENDVAFSATGRITDAWLTKLIDWWALGARADNMPARGSDEEVGNFIIVSQNGALSLTYGTPYPQEMGKPVAWGSGANYAIGAMEMGADAMRAVLVAMKHDGPTGGDIEFIDMEDIGRGVQVWHPETDTATLSDAIKPLPVGANLKDLMAFNDRMTQEIMKKYCGYEDFAAKHNLPVMTAEDLNAHNETAAAKHYNDHFDAPQAKPEPLIILGYMDIVGDYTNILGDMTAFHYRASEDHNYAYREILTGPCSTERHATTQLRDLLADYVRLVDAPKGTPIAWRILPEVTEVVPGKWKGYARLAVLTGQVPVADTRPVIITKPSRTDLALMNPDGPGYVRGWFPKECNGRLVLGTGCGHCLRCNREWYALLRHMPQPKDIHVTHITLTDEQIKQSIASLTMSGAAMPVGDGVALTTATHPGWPNGLGVDPDPVEAPGQSPQFALEAWVEAWNAASVRNNMYEVGRLEQQLRKMTFPDGCELVTEYDDSVSGWQRRIVYGETEIS